MVQEHRCMLFYIYAGNVTLPRVIFRIAFYWTIAEMVYLGIIELHFMHTYVLRFQMILIRNDKLLSYFSEFY